MAALMLQVPPETARILHEIPVPGDKEQHDPHITVIYLGKNVPVENISEMLPVIYDVTARTVPFSVSTSHVTTFPPGDDGVPVIARIGSPELHSFREALCRALEDAGIEYNKKFPVYNPHTTLAFDKDPDTHGKVDIDIPPITWGAHELVLWGSDRGTGRLVVKFPLSLPKGRVASARDNGPLHRAIIQVAAWAQRDKFA